LLVTVESEGVTSRVTPESGSGLNLAFFPNPAPGKIPPEPDVKNAHK